MLTIIKLQNYFPGEEYINSKTKLHWLGLFLENFFWSGCWLKVAKAEKGEGTNGLEAMWFEEQSSNKMVRIFNSVLMNILKLFSNAMSSNLMKQVVTLGWQKTLSSSLKVLDNSEN